MLFVACVDCVNIRQNTDQKLNVHSPQTDFIFALRTEAQANIKGENMTSKPQMSEERLRYLLIAHAKIATGTVLPTGL